MYGIPLVKVYLIIERNGETRPILKWQCSREGYTENILYPVK